VDRRTRLQLVAGLLLVGAVRLYYTILTFDQPVWWDEAEYLLKARSIALGTPDTGFYVGRPIVPSLAMAGFFGIGLGEGSIRIALALASTAAVYLTYRLGLRFVDRTGAVCGAALFASFYVPVFYSTRIMVEIPFLVLLLLGANLFLSGRTRLVALSGPVLVLAVLTRFPGIVMVVALGLYDVFGNRARVLRSTGGLAAIGLGALVAAPYLLWAQLAHGDPLVAVHAYSFVMPSLTLGERIDNMLLYLGWHSSALGFILLSLIAVGIVLVFVRGRRDAPGPDAIAAPGLLMVLWILVPLGYYGFFVTAPDAIDRYLIGGLPLMFIAAGGAITYLASAVARRRAGLAAEIARIATGIVIALLLPDGDRLIRTRIESFAPLRQASLWIHDHTGSDARIMTASAAQATYYSQRASFFFSTDVATTLSQIRDQGIGYVVIHAEEQHPPWLNELLESPGLGARLVASIPAQNPTAQVFSVHPGDGQTPGPRVTPSALPARREGAAAR
jgi:4-amino-4-deoxy-L-arabinose transferase-like glycosyltransferase